MNGRHQQVGPPQQASRAAAHLPNDGTRAWGASNTLCYRTGNSGVHPSQSYHLALQTGGYSNRQMASWRRSEDPHPVPQKKTTDHFNDYIQRPPSHLPNTSSPLPTTCGSQASTMQNSHQYPSNQSFPRKPSPNTTYHQQDMSVYWKQPVTVNERQMVDPRDVPLLQKKMTSQRLIQCLTAKDSSYAAAFSPPQQQGANSSSLVSAATQNVQTAQQVAPNQIFRQNYSESTFSPVYPSSCPMVNAQSFGNGSTGAQPFSNGQALCAPNTNQKTQQTATRVNSSYSNWGGPTDCRNTSLINQKKSNSFLVKTSELPLNPAAASQNMLRNQVSADGFGSKCYTSSSDHNLPPSYNSHHFISTPRMSTQNTQPLTSACSETSDLNATQPFSVHSGQSAPQSVTSRGQLPVNTQPPQNLFPIAYSVNTSGSGRKETVRVSLANNNNNNNNNDNMVLKGCPMRSSDGPQLFQGPQSTQTQKDEFEFIKKHRNMVELFGLPSTMKQNDNSAHQVPGHTSTKAVAVVLPLSQEDVHTATTATCESIDNTEKECINEKLVKSREVPCFTEVLDREDPNSVRVNQADKHALTSSDSESQSSRQTSELDNIKSAAQNPPEVPQNQMATPPSPPVVELSSILTKTWTIGALSKSIFELEKARPMPRDNPKHSTIIKILITMWDKNINALLQHCNSSLITNLISEVEKFCSLITQDSVIVTEVKSKDQLKQFYVLEDDEVYSEQPYKSSWLNVNDQLDDIDKEFGFPWTFKQRLCMNKTYSQTSTVNSVPESIMDEVQNEVLSEPEPESVDFIEEKDMSTVETPLTPPVSPGESDSSSDANYSFKIEVLPPEEAKAIYEQEQIHQGTGNADGTASSRSSQTEISRDTDATSKSEAKNESEDQIKEICCLASLMESYSVLGSPSCKCLCKENQSVKGLTVETRKSDPENPAKKDEDIDCQTITLSAPEHCSKLHQIIELTDDDKFHQSSSDEVPEAIFQISNDSQSDIISMSDKESESVSSSDLVIPSEVGDVIKKTDSQDKSPEEEGKSSETIMSSSSVSSAEQTEHDQLCHTGTEMISLMSDQKDDCEQTNLKSVEEAETPLASEGQTEITNQTSFSHHVDTPKDKQKHQSSLDQFFPGQTSKKCLADLDSFDLLESQPAAVGVKTVELVLFGSGQQAQSSSSGHKKSIASYPSTGSYLINKPPEVLSVNLEPSKRKSTETEHPGNYSVKELIYKRWMESLPTPTCSDKNRHRNKLKRHKHWSASQSFTSSKELQSLSPEMKFAANKSKFVLSLKKRRSLSDLRKLEEKRRRFSVPLGQLEDEEEKRPQNENLDIMPLQENSVLKFSVLPNTFNFKDGSSRMKQSSDPFSGYPKPEEKDQRPDTTVTKSKGSWCAASTNQQQASCVPQTVSLFHEYQKKYKKKTQPSTDEPSDK